MSAPVPRLVGLYGGSFDPIHLGHLATVEEAADRLGLDEIVLIPAFAPPHKPSGPVASGFHRFAMAALAIDGHVRLRLSDFELARGGTTYTIDTLRHFQAAEPGVRIVLVVGSDSLATFATWRAWREMVAAHPIAVLHREPFDYAALLPTLPPEILERLAPEGATPLDGPPGKTIYWGGNRPATISSTWVRNAVREGRPLRGSVPPAVESYLRRHGLYRPGPPAPPTWRT